jgi:hypothetical protein
MNIENTTQDGIMHPADVSWRLTDTESGRFPSYKQAKYQIPFTPQEMIHISKENWWVYWSMHVLNSGNSVQNLLPSRPLSKNIKIRIYRTSKPYAQTWMTFSYTSPLQHFTSWNHSDMYSFTPSLVQRNHNTIQHSLAHNTISVSWEPAHNLV